MPDVLIHADTMRSAELRHEVPLGVPDPFLFGEAGGTRHVLVHSMEAVRMGGLPCEVHVYEQYGYDELLKSGLDREEASLELIRRAVRDWGIERAVVPPSFPLETADALRAAGVEVTADRSLFEERRRVKTAAELAGIRRAQKAAAAAMGAARELLRRATANGSSLTLDGTPLTSERIKEAIDRTFAAHGCSADEMIVSHGAQSAIGHHGGEGPIAPGEPVVIDIWPRDRETGCFADMTRTFVVGEIPDEVREWHRLCVQALEDAVAATRPGASGRAIYDGTCDLFERHGHPTQRTKSPGAPLEDGFFHGLGHGVGLEVHEAPGLGLSSKDTLVAGDVVTVEPGLYRPGFGGVRVEDLLLVTEDGAENLTDFPYGLEP